MFTENDCGMVFNLKNTKTNVKEEFLLCKTRLVGQGDDEYSLISIANSISLFDEPYTLTDLNNMVDDE